MKKHQCYETHISILLLAGLLLAGCASPAAASAAAAPVAQEPAFFAALNALQLQYGFGVSWKRLTSVKWMLFWPAKTTYQR